MQPGPAAGRAGAKEPQAALEAAVVGHTLSVVGCNGDGGGDGVSTG